MTHSSVCQVVAGVQAIDGGGPRAHGTLAARWERKSTVCCSLVAVCGVDYRAHMAYFGVGLCLLLLVFRLLVLRSGRLAPLLDGLFHDRGLRGCVDTRGSAPAYTLPRIGVIDLGMITYVLGDEVGRQEFVFAAPHAVLLCIAAYRYDQELA